MNSSSLLAPAEFHALEAEFERTFQQVILERQELKRAEAVLLVQRTKVESLARRAADIAQRVRVEGHKVREALA